MILLGSTLLSGNAADVTLLPMNRLLAFLLLALAPAACQLPHGADTKFSTSLESADELIEPGETHFKHLWMLTDGGENAEAYWSFDGKSLSFQRRIPREGIDCDRIFVVSADGGLAEQVSNGRGVTTCSYYMPNGAEVLFASTHGEQDDCPPKPDFSQGYVWPIHPEFDIWVTDLESGMSRTLIGGPGYDAEATVSPTGDRIVFTSTRTGDLELFTCDLDGGNIVQVTDALGYDGGAFFSHDGTQLVFRATGFTPGQEAEEGATYMRLLEDDKVRPHTMDIYLINADGSDRRKLTDLGGASFAPSFYPDDARIMFSTNHHDPRDPARNFDLFSMTTEGTDLERITTFEGFDSFPLFSPDGRFVAFASNRGNTEPGDTNVFIAEWQ